MRRRSRRRSKQEIRLGRFVTIGQRWHLRSSDTFWRIHQVHRADAMVTLKLIGPVPLTPPGVKFATALQIPIITLAHGRGWAWVPFLRSERSA